MTAALTDELSRTTPTRPCCRRAEMITVLRFAGGLHHQDGQLRIEVDLPTLAVARRVGATIRALYGYPTQLHALPTPGSPAATRHRLRITRHADAAALARRTGLLDPRGRPIRGLPAPLVAGAVCDAAAIWRGAFLAAGTLTEPHRFPALEVTCPSLETAMALTGAARRLGIPTRTKHLRDTDRVTVGDPDAITALLTQIGAPNTATTWAHHRIQRRAHTPEPRRPGFDDANHTRATHAAAAAATRVQRALVILGDQVPDNLAAVAALRMTHHEASLEALGQLMNPPMTKDAVAGRIRRLLALADTTARDTRHHHHHHHPHPHPEPATRGFPHEVGRFLPRTSTHPAKAGSFRECGPPATPARMFTGGRVPATDRRPRWRTVGAGGRRRTLWVPR